MFNTWPREYLVSWYPVIGLITKVFLSLSLFLSHTHTHTHTHKHTFTHTQVYPSMCFLTELFQLWPLRPKRISYALMFFHSKPLMEHFITFTFSLFPSETKTTNRLLFILRDFKLSELLLFSVLLWKILETFRLCLVTGCNMKSYLQEERQNRYKCVGAARQQGEGSATVHPQRVISWCRYQPDQKQKKKTLLSHKNLNENVRQDERRTEGSDCCSLGRSICKSTASEVTHDIIWCMRTHRLQPQLLSQLCCCPSTSCWLTVIKITRHHSLNACLDLSAVQ